MTTFSEAIKLKDGVLFNLGYHQERMNRTLQKFYGTAGVDLSVLNTLVPPHAVDGLFKCRVLYTDKIESVEYIPYTFRHLQTVGIVTGNDINYGYKYADRTRINNLLKQSACDDILIVKDGRVTDASSSSLVFQSPEGLFTPEDYLLPGTKRQLLLDQGRITERIIRADEVKMFDNVYFINAMVDLEDGVKVETSALRLL